MPKKMKMKDGRKVSKNSEGRGVYIPGSQVQTALAINILSIAVNWKLCVNAFLFGKSE